MHWEARGALTIKTDIQYNGKSESREECPVERPFLTRKFFARFLSVFSGFLVLLMIIALPIISLCSREVERQNQSLYQQTIAQQLEQADSQLASLIEQLQFFCSDDPDFLSLANPGVPLDYLTMNSFHQNLSNMLHGYSLIKDVVLVTRNDVIITSRLSAPNRALMTHIFFEQFFVTDAVRTPEELRAMNQSYRCLTIREYYNGEYLALATCRPLLNSTAQLVGHVLITLDLNQLLQDMIPQEFAGLADVRVSYDGHLLHEQTVDGISSPVTISMRGTQTGVQVDVTVPKSLLHQSIRSILTAIWLLVGTALLGGLALTIVFLLMTSRPMRRLTQAARAIAPAIQAQNEYEYIEGTLAQLGRSMEQSQEEIAQQRALLQQTVLEKAMLGGLAAQQEFATLIPDFPQRYQIALVQMPVSEDAHSAIEMALSERLMLEHLLSDQFTQVLHFLHISTGTAALVLPEHAGGAEALESLREAFLRHYQLPVNIYLGDMVSGENRISEAYASAKYIQSCAAAYIEKRVWHRGNFPAQLSSFSNVDYTVFQPLYEALFNGRKDKALECLARLRQTLPTLDGSAHANRRTLEFAHSILIRVKQERFDLLCNVPLPFPDMRQTLASCLRAMEENVILLCDSLSQFDTQSASFSKEIVAWVDNNFTDPDLYLKTVTAHFKINEKALQAAMHDVTGTSFAEYLENKRLTHAAMLLDTTRQNVKEIGQQSGFALYNTFYKSFKRRYGRSPMEYRTQKEE